MHKEHKDWNEKWGNVLLVQKFNYKERTPRSPLKNYNSFIWSVSRVSLYVLHCGSHHRVLKKACFFYFISFFFSKNFLTLMPKYVHSSHFIWLCWIQEVLQLYSTCKVIILIVATGSACASQCFSIQICISFSYPALTPKIWGQPWSASVQWQSGSTWWCCGCVMEEEALHIL